MAISEIKVAKVWNFRFRCLCVNSVLLPSIRLALGKIGSSVKCGSSGPFVGLGSWLQKLDMHYLYAADGVKLGKVWNFRFRCLCVNSDLLPSIRLALGKIGSSVKCGGQWPVFWSLLRASKARHALFVRK